MMYRVIRAFTDKTNNELINAGREIDLSPSRAKEIMSAGKYIVKVETAKPEPTEVAPTEAAEAKPKKKRKKKTVKE